MDEISKYEFDYPKSLIGLDPLENRQEAKMLVSNQGSFVHDKVGNLTDYLTKDDLLVFNNTKVIPCRLKAKKIKNVTNYSAIEIEVTLNKLEANEVWSSFCLPGKKVKVDDVLKFENDFFAKVVKISNGLYFLKFNKAFKNLIDSLDKIGEMPIPPYILKKRGFRRSDFQNYQTTFAEHNGSVAAPTASLHFDKNLLKKIKKKKVPFCFVTLHISGGTFIPIKSDKLSDHKMHSEFAKVDCETVSKIKDTLYNGGRVIAVGTTAMRVLESDQLSKGSDIKPFAEEIDTFITPGHKFKVCSGLLTNFHQPRSTLFVLVNAFIGMNNSQTLYREAINQKYRLFSYGDCCLLFA